MRIAIVIDSLVRDGAERQALCAARELSRNDCDVELIYYHKVDRAYDLSELGQAKGTFLPKKGTYLRFLWRLRNYLKRGRFDVVHAYKSSPSIYGCLAAKLAGTPVVLGGLRVEYRDRGMIRLAHRVLSRLITGWVVNSRAIVDSTAEAIGAKRSTFSVVYNAIEPQQFVSALTASEAKREVGVDPHGLVVTIIARLEPQKNHMLFLDMAVCVRKDHPDVRFLIVGEGDLRPALEARARALGLADHVLFLGGRADIPDLLAATDVSVLTSHYEGLSNALLESMCVGIPVVTTDYAGADELVADGLDGYIVPRDNARAMADRIGELFNDAGLRRRMGEAGAKKVERQFSSDAMVTALRAIYGSCLAATLSPR